jgi:hypothetical protein
MALGRFFGTHTPMIYDIEAYELTHCSKVNDSWLVFKLSSPPLGSVRMCYHNYGTDRASKYHRNDVLGVLDFQKHDETTWKQDCLFNIVGLGLFSSEKII